MTGEGRNRSDGRANGEAPGDPGELPPHRLARLLNGPRPVLAVGVYDGLTALAASRHDLDAVWISGLGVSAALGLPDASITSMTDFLGAARVVCRCTQLPVIADADSGFGDVNTLLHMLAEYQRLGVAAVCIEDKVFPKRNSFAGPQHLADPAEFAATLRAATAHRSPAAPLLIARVESLVAGAGLADALARARLYVQAGADAVLVHSRAREPDEVLAFAREFRSCDDRTPLFALPTTYPQADAGQLHAAGFSAVIYANQLLRGFLATADELLDAIGRTGSSLAAEGRLAPVADVLALLGCDAVEARDREHHLAAVEYARAAGTDRQLSYQPDGKGPR